MLADQIDEVYREHFVPGEEEKVFYAFDDNGHYEQRGEFPAYIIQDIAGLAPEVADAVVALLSAEESRDVTDGVDPRYEAISCYVRRELYPYEQEGMWDEFCHRVKHHRRYFDEKCRQLLDSLLGDLLQLEPSPILRLRLGKSEKLIYRARRASDFEEAERFRISPARDLGPPPLEKALAGRMSPHGIPVFYGAFSERGAIAEVRPSVGVVVVVGQFAVMAPLKLLDLTQFTAAPLRSSMFAPGYVRRVTQYRFLRRFLVELSRPIQPHEEPLEYVPTQAVAGYLAEALHLDGIVYPSAQLGGTEDEDNLFQDDEDEDRFALSNVALFDATVIVATAHRRSRSKKSRTLPEEPTFADLWLLELEENLNTVQEPERKPALRYIDGSASVKRITYIDIKYT
jgi:hypothetical protein